MRFVPQRILRGLARNKGDNSNILDKGAFMVLVPLRVGESLGIVEKQRKKPFNQPKGC
jgi:hypothetical protein